MCSDAAVCPGSMAVRPVRVTDREARSTRSKTGNWLPSIPREACGAPRGQHNGQGGHFRELRPPLNEAHQRALAARETVLKAVHLSELRSSVLGIVS